MNLSRRSFVGAAALMLATPSLVRGQGKWPGKTIRMVVGSAPGGLTDLYARLYGDFISSQTGITAVIETKTGALGALAATEVKRAPADGHTLLFSTSGALIQNSVLVKDLAYDPERDFELVSAMPTGGLMLVISKRVGATTLEEFIKYARSNERVSLGTFGVGSSAHMTIVELNKQYGLKIEPVHYRGEAPMFTDLAGQVLDGGMGSFMGVQPVLQSGAGVPVAICRKRLTTLPDVATFKEQGTTSPFFELTSYICCAVAKATDPDIIEQLSSLLVRAGASEKAKAMLQTYGVDEAAMTRAATRDLYQRESAQWISFASAIVADGNGK